MGNELGCIVRTLWGLHSAYMLDDGTYQILTGSGALLIKSAHWRSEG